MDSSLLHFTEVDPTSWDFANFSPAELACPCCGEVYEDLVPVSRLQTVREQLGIPVRVNSAHRCWLYNAMSGCSKL